MNRVVPAEEPAADTAGQDPRSLALRARILQVVALADPVAALPELKARLAAAPADRAGEERLFVGIAHRRAKHLLPALLCFDEVEYEAERADDTLLVMFVNQQLGILSGMLGDRHRARAALQRAVSAAERLGDTRGLAVALSNLGYLHGEQRQTVPYREHTERALVLSRSLGDRSMIASNLCNLGGALASLRLFDEARAVYDEGERIATEIGWEIGKARFVSGRANLLCKEGALDLGDRVFDSAIKRFRDLGDHYHIARIAVQRGNFHLEAGRPASALGHFDEALQLAAEWSFDSVPADVLENRAVAMEQVGDQAGALASLRALLALRLRDTTERAVEREEVANARAIAMRARWQAEDERQRSQELARMNETLRDALAREEALRAEVERLARTDVLTGLANRRFTQELLDRAVAQALRSGAPLCVALLDIDNFKAINDTYGHAAGDRALEEIGRRLGGAVRASDIVGRWGGEEFLVVFTSSTSEVARLGAERLRGVIGGAPVAVTGTVTLPITLSAGIARRASDDRTADTMLAAADHALYAAKAGGRDRVVVAPS
ncbi:MAG: diguanylate cyclase [Myxococcota bacterium]